MATDVRAVELTSFVQTGLEQSEQAQVEAIAARLLDHLNEAQILAAITTADMPGRSSADVQATFLLFAQELGFTSEKKGLFATYDGNALRPDYFMPVCDSGILLEVERGKTTINNMDLLDFWKCHICAHAQYLFLMVPKLLRQNPTMSPRNEYATVTRRLRVFFFEPENYTNVRGLFIFGY